MPVLAWVGGGRGEESVPFRGRERKKERKEGRKEGRERNELGRRGLLEVRGYKVARERRRRRIHGHWRNRVPEPTNKTEIYPFGLELEELELLGWVRGIGDLDTALDRLQIFGQLYLRSGRTLIYRESVSRLRFLFTMLLPPFLDGSLTFESFKIFSPAPPFFFFHESQSLKTESVIDQRELFRDPFFETRSLELGGKSNIPRGGSPLT